VSRYVVAAGAGLALAFVTTVARAQPAPPADPATDAAAPTIFPVDPADRGADFGPVLTIEAIEVRGNQGTADKVIIAALPIKVGDVIRAGDPRLQTARFKVLGLGFFRDVQLGLHRGTERGRVHLVVTVEERGTVSLERLWFGTSATSPWWFGADLDQRNFLGKGIGVGGGAVYAKDAGVAGAHDQWAAELRIFDASIRGSRWGVMDTLDAIDASEPYRVAGPSYGTGVSDFRAMSYRRLGDRLSVTYALSPLSRLIAAYRIELVHADLPAAPVRQLPSGELVPVPIDLEPGDSRVVTGSLAYDIDTRPDPALPRSGYHFAVSAELGSRLLGGSYDFATLLARYDRWWPVRRRESIAVRLAGGVVLGDAPRFDRIYAGDVDRMATPRALGLVVAPNTSYELLGTGLGGVQYGDVGGSAVVEYSYQLWRGGAHIYGGDIFFGAGLWALSTGRDLALRDAGWWRALPVDAVVDAGLRVDTDIGVFELSIANALGRVPP
jgi:outer membrane protein assembly factor BamA